MSGPLPHTKKITAQANDYISDALARFSINLSSHKNSSAFRNIYWDALAFDGFLCKASRPPWKPNVKGARTIILRVPWLAASGHASAALIELRRLIELGAWTIYFTDHPIEWRRFQTSPNSGFHNNLEQPIQYCAHRNLKFYLDYAAERLSEDPSGMGKTSINEIRLVSEELNSVVHPGSLGATIGRIPAFEDMSEKALQKFGKIQNRACSNLGLSLAATFTKGFDLLPPMYRANFDRMIGSARAKKIRSGPFGIPY